MLRIALIYPPLTDHKGHYPLLTQNRQFRYSSSTRVKIFPLVMASAATLLQKRGYQVLFLDGINRRQSLQEFEELLLQFQPDLVVLESKAPIIRRHWLYLERLKSLLPTCRSVLVGDHVTALPEESLQTQTVDYCVTGGDYDVVLLGLADFLYGENPELPPGVYWRKGSRIKESGTSLLTADLDRLPFIDRELTRWRDYGEAYLHRPVMYVSSGRGCGGNGTRPGQCRFCCWQHTFWRCTSRLRSPEHFVDELETLYRQYKVVEVFDDNEAGATFSQAWLEEVYRLMVKRRLVGKLFLSSNSRADSLTVGTCSLLKKMNFRLLKVGLEAGTNRTLARLDKQETVEQIRHGVKNAKDVGLIVMLTTMMGYPWETEEDALATYELARELMFYKTRFGDSLQSSVIVPYPGTPLYAEAVRRGWLLFEKDDYEKFDMSRPILKSAYDPLSWCNRMWGIHKHPTFLLKSLTSVRSCKDVTLALRGISSLLGHLKDFRAAAD
jgi:radical SAM superfamily enzyme YgiQ (UPF0313 family)